MMGFTAFVQYNEFCFQLQGQCAKAEKPSALPKKERELRPTD